MHLEILTPDKKVFSGEITSVNLPGSAGYFEVYTNHAALISTLDKGTIRISSNNKEENIVVDGGVVEVLNNNIIVLAEAILN
jgi:F-type H+-transporting ATPase subunit epsilon